MIAARESITAALKAALLVLVFVACVLSVVLFVQANFFNDPALLDSDGDGFTDSNEWSWWTSRLDPYDNPFTTRILPILVSATIIAVVLILVKVHPRRRASMLAPTLLEKLRAMKAAVCMMDRGRINACKADFDATIAELRDGKRRGVLHEPSIQDILVEFEVLCLDAHVDEMKGIGEKMT
ncbi:MAG: hypothetical protein Q6373_013535 [Candidatus Sigynarchaeota archaeon]